MIAGLEDITDGTICIGGRVVNRVEPKDRNIAMVFQNYAIYPHMTVAKNIGFGLCTSKLSKAEKQKRLAETAALLGLDRASAIAGPPSSPAASASASPSAAPWCATRRSSCSTSRSPTSMRSCARRCASRSSKLHQTLKRTIVFVTHDQIEAMTIADRIVIMKDGEILQIGTPDQVYRKPANIFVAKFIGSPAMNMLPARVAAGQIVIDGLGSIAAPTVCKDGQRLTIGVRPDDLTVADGHAKGLTVDADVTLVEPQGPDALVYVRLGTHEVIAKSDARVLPRPGARVRLTTDSADLHLFDPDTGRAVGSA